MSQENVEIVRRGYEAFSRGDLDAMVMDFAPSFEYVPPGTIPGFEQDAYGGPVGWTQFVGWMREEFDDVRAEIDAVTDAGDQVLVGVIVGGRGKQSGVESSWHLWHLWAVHEGKLVRGQGFVNKQEALEAAGLRE